MVNYVYSHSARAGQLHFFPIIFGFYQESVFLCFLEMIMIIYDNNNFNSVIPPGGKTQRQKHYDKMCCCFVGNLNMHVVKILLQTN